MAGISPTLKRLVTLVRARDGCKIGNKICINRGIITVKSINYTVHDEVLSLSILPLDAEEPDFVPNDRK